MNVPNFIFNDPSVNVADWEETLDDFFQSKHQEFAINPNLDLYVSGQSSGHVKQYGAYTNAQYQYQAAHNVAQSKASYNGRVQRSRTSLPAQGTPQWTECCRLYVEDYPQMGISVPSMAEWWESKQMNATAATAPTIAPFNRLFTQLGWEKPVVDWQSAVHWPVVYLPTAIPQAGQSLIQDTLSRPLPAVQQQTTTTEAISVASVQSEESSQVADLLPGHSPAVNSKELDVPAIATAAPKQLEVNTPAETSVPDPIPELVGSLQTPSSLSVMEISEQLQDNLRRNAISSNLTQDNRGRALNPLPPIPDAWWDAERLIGPIWKPFASTVRSSTFLDWDDAKTPDDNAILATLKHQSLWKPTNQDLSPFDETLPHTFNERRRYAYTLFAAMRDVETGFNEVAPSSGNKNTHPVKLLNGKFTAALIQARCFEVVDEMIELHCYGATLEPEHDPTMEQYTSSKKVADDCVHITKDGKVFVKHKEWFVERYHTFERRFTEVCMSVTNYKSIADELIIGTHTKTIIYAPACRRQRKLRDARVNRNKYLLAQAAVARNSSIAKGKDTRPTKNGSLKIQGDKVDTKDVGNAKRPSLIDPSHTKVRPVWAMKMAPVIPSSTVPPPMAVFVPFSAVYDIIFEFAGALSTVARRADVATTMERVARILHTIPDPPQNLTFGSGTRPTHDGTDLEAVHALTVGEDVWDELNDNTPEGMNEHPDAVVSHVKSDEQDLELADEVPTTSQNKRKRAKARDEGAPHKPNKQAKLA